MVHQAAVHALCRLKVLGLAFLRFCFRFSILMVMFKGMRHVRELRANKASVVNILTDAVST